MKDHEDTRGATVLPFRSGPRKPADITCTYCVGSAPNRRRCGKRAFWMLSRRFDERAPDRAAGFVAFSCHECLDPEDREVLDVAFLSDNVRAALVAGGPRCFRHDCTHAVDAWGDFCATCRARFA